MMGAPLIMKEKLVSGETVKAIKCLQNLYDNGYCNGQLPSSFDKNIHKDEGTRYINNYNTVINEVHSQGSTFSDNYDMPAIDLL